MAGTPHSITFLLLSQERKAGHVPSQDIRQEGQVTLHLSSAMAALRRMPKLLWEFLPECRAVWGVDRLGLLCQHPKDTSIFLGLLAFIFVLQVPCVVELS